MFIIYHEHTLKLKKLDCCVRGLHTGMYIRTAHSIHRRTRRVFLFLLLACLLNLNIIIQYSGGQDTRTTRTVNPDPLTGRASPPSHMPHTYAPERERAHPLPRQTSRTTSPYPGARA